MTEQSATSTGAQTRRYEKKREQILDAAAMLFNASGLGGTTLADVAAAVGLTTTSVTYYHRKKEDLAAACLARAIAVVDALIAEAEEADTAEEALRRLLAGFAAHLAASAEGRAPHLINFWDLRALTGPQAETTTAAFVGLFRRIRTFFERHGGPAFTRSEQNARAHLVLSAVIRFKGWIDRYEPEDYPRAAARLADVMIGGLAGAGRVWAPVPLDLSLAKGEAASQVSREAFLRAATELVNESGYRGASVDRISARLKVTKGSFYHHNETKDELVAECFARSFETVRRAHRAALATEGDGWTRLSSMVASLTRLQLSPEGPLLRLSALSATVEARRPGLLAELARLTEKTTGLIADGIVDGSIRAVDATVAGQLVAGAINAAAEIARWAPAATMDTASDLFARPLARGVFAPPG